MLKELFDKTLPNYYNEVSKKETHIYMSNVNKVVDDTKKRLRELKVEHLTEGNHDIVEGIHLAICEMSFMTSEIMLEQLKDVSDGK